jgi:hypothetical protein
MTAPIDNTKYMIVLATDNIARAQSNLIEALIRDNKGSIGSRLIDAERSLSLALTDVAKAFAALNP